MAVRPKISPFLWFDGRCMEAARFYVSVFPNSRIIGDEELQSGPAEGSAFVEFEIEGAYFAAVDGGPMYQFTPAISFVVQCDSQEEIDYYWNALSEDGMPEQCGWLRDKFGVSWQIVPSMLGELMERNPAAVMDALLQMVKIDIAKLREASLSG